MPQSNPLMRSDASRFIGALALSAVLLTGTAAGAYAQSALRFATTLPPTNMVTVQCFEPWIKKTNEVANGKFHIQLVHGPTIANAVNVWDRVADGVVDIGWGIHGAVNLPFPKSTIVGLPLLLPEGMEEEGAVSLWRLYQSGLIADEYKDVRPIMLSPTPVQGLSLRSSVTSLDDLKGLKLRAADKVASDVVTALGASSISVPAPEVYQALSQGVVSGSIANPIMLTVFKLGEVVKHHVEGVPLGAPAGFVVMNPNAYSSLSEKGKKIFDAETGEKFSREMGACFSKLGRQLKSRIRQEPGQTFVTLDPAERKRWEASLQTVNQNWLKSTPEGEKIYNAFTKELGQQ